MKNLKKKSVEAVLSKSDALLSKKQERRGRSQTRNSAQQNNDNCREISKFQRRNMKCFHCQRMGHVKMECRLWKREQAKEKG